MRDNLTKDDLIIKITQTGYDALTPTELNELTKKELAELYKSIIDKKIADTNNTDDADVSTTI